MGIGCRNKVVQRLIEVVGAMHASSPFPVNLGWLQMTGQTTCTRLDERYRKKAADKNSLKTQSLSIPLSVGGQPLTCCGTQFRDC